MKKILRYIGRYAARFAGAMGTKTTGAFLELFIPWVLAHIIDVIIPTRSVPMVLLWGGLMVLCSLLAWGCNICANRMAAAVSRDVTEDIRHDLFARISYLTNRDIDRFTIPSLITRMTSDTYVIHRSVGMMQRIGIRAPILLIGGIIMTLSLDPILTLVMLATMPVVFYITFTVSRKGVRLFRNVQAGSDEMFRVVRENATGVRVIKALSKSEYERRRFAETNADLTAREKKASDTMAIINPAMSFMLNMGLVAVVLVGAYRVNAGLTGVGNIIAFMNYFTIILNALMSINRIFTMLSQLMASADRIAEVLDCNDELSLHTNAEVKPVENAPHIEFDNVTFTYPYSKFTLDHFSFSVNHGETLGIIGATGSGKSTILQVLMRFYEVTGGAIRVNGVDVRDYSAHDLRGKFGVVFQNDILFNDTIVENIRFGREVSMADIDRAVADAQAAGFIEETGGYDAQLSIKGANLSGGQKQRLLIARALAGQPEILVLDDSSSALDYKTDALLREKIREHHDASTKIIIAQRISSVMHAEKILVLDEGKIVGYGSHKELMANCPLYREIGETQMGVSE
ncbi:MAG: ABC transporter ATP-binding protein [Clostridia bacterium]|nr:ABC transporter ATP-binding protein [Clostridia bacterium]